MNINFTKLELELIKEIATQQDISEEKVLIQALRWYQLKLLDMEDTDDSPGCGLIE